MTNELLRKIVSEFPSKPGIYKFTTDGREIYIGKAANLKNRLSSYRRTNDSRILKMLFLADDIRFQITDSDIEALILESRLIKNLRPKFNIMLRDDKQYFYVGITEDVFPKIFLTHQPTKNQNAKIKTQNDNEKLKNNWKLEIGNWKFHSAEAEWLGPFTDGTALKITLRYLRRIFPYCTCKNPHNNFCLNYHIGKCVGVCCLKKPVSSIKYQVLREYKRNVRAIKDVLSGKKESFIKRLEKEMKQLAKNGDLERAVELRSKIANLKRVFENAHIIQTLKTQNKKSFDISIYGCKRTLRELKEVLKLPLIPNRIEGYDVSNIQGVHATGSMVVFEDGVPNKNQYRMFKIRDKKTPDDIFMLNEVLQRRFNHPEWEFPGLILIDGGRGQLNTAKEIIKILDLKIPIISLAKGKYEIFSTTLNKPVSMAKLSPNVRNLIKNIDAEAHRFAISFYRKLHRKKALRPY